MEMFVLGKVKDIEQKGQSDSMDLLFWNPKHADLIVTASAEKTICRWDGVVK